MSHRRLALLVIQMLALLLSALGQSWCQVRPQDFVIPWYNPDTWQAGAGDAPPAVGQYKVTIVKPEEDGCDFVVCSAMPPRGPAGCNVLIKAYAQGWVPGDQVQWFVDDTLKGSMDHLEGIPGTPAFRTIWDTSGSTDNPPQHTITVKLLDGSGNVLQPSAPRSVVFHRFNFGASGTISNYWLGPTKYGGPHSHHGIDISYRTDNSDHAASRGTVVGRRYEGTIQYTITLIHVRSGEYLHWHLNAESLSYDGGYTDRGVYTEYHMMLPEGRPDLNTTLARGDPIGTMDPLPHGKYSTGPHLHLCVMIGGTNFNTNGINPDMNTTASSVGSRSVSWQNTTIYPAWPCP